MAGTTGGTTAVNTAVTLGTTAVATADNTAGAGSRRLLWHVFNIHVGDSGCAAAREVLKPNVSAGHMERRAGR